MTRPEALPNLPERLSAWLESGAQGEMRWMAERADQRADPRTLWPEVRSIIMLGMNYGPETDPLDLLARRERGAIAAYAQRRDYHEVIKGKLKELGGYLSAKGDVRVKVFVDTAPVMEKPLAAAAGLGWQGKHTVLISRELGNWLLLGAIYTSADLAPDAPEVDHCGSCRRCLDACPTNAFPAPRVLDATRCVSYLTIELKGAIPEALREGVGDRIYGCDVCQDACPWNLKFAEPLPDDSPYAARAALAGKDPRQLARDLLGMRREEFSDAFNGSPMKRAKLRGLKRNAAVVLGNVGTAEDLGLLERVSEEEPEEMVREHAAWALHRLRPV